MSVSSYKKFFLIFCCSSVLLTYALFTAYNNSTATDYYRRLYATENEIDWKCRIPQLDPFGPEAMKLLKDPVTEKDMCGHIPHLFESPPSLESLIVPVIPLREFKKIGISSCCYRAVTPMPMNGYSLSDTCHPLSLTKATKLPPNIEFAAVYCSLYTNSPELKYSFLEKREIHTSILVDFHSFVNLKPDVEQRLGNVSSPPSAERLNVLVVGSDAVSRNQMIRAMPLTYKFLLEDLKAVDMKGYNSIGPNTFPSLAPFFFSMSGDEVIGSCLNDSRFDSCPIIWKEFAKRGYRTSFHEDTHVWSIFISFDKSMNGFHDVPTDYNDIGPMRLAVNEAPWGSLCIGPRLSIKFLLDYTKKFVLRMDAEKKSYFHFVWSGQLTHDVLECARLEDVLLRDLLQWLRDGGHLRKTALVLMSDHGLKSVSWSEANIAESKLPFMFFVLPKSFKGTYSQAYQNLEANSNYRLTTTYDLRQTLLDILEPERLQIDPLIWRQSELKERELEYSMPLGISQFLTIPGSRYCENAGIPTRVCVCQGTWEKVSVDLKYVSEGAKFAVKEINRLLRHHRSTCSFLTLSKVLSAKMNIVSGRQRGTDMVTAKTSVVIQIETEPGSGQYEVQIFFDGKKFEITKQIVRLDRYSIKGQGKCVKGKSIEKFCICKPAPKRICVDCAYNDY